MRYLPKREIVLLFLLSITFQQLRCQPKDETYLCIGNYQTEAQAVEQLKSFSKMYSTKEEWLRRADSIKANILKGAELDKIPIEYRNLKFNTILSEKRVLDGYTVQNISIDGMPGHKITGNLYLPIKLKKKNPVIVSPHGHWFSPDNYGRFRPDVQYRCAAFAKMGAIVFTYDMIGFGECTSYKHSDTKATKIQIFNSMRVLDYLLSLSYADKKNVGVTGASGGGTQTILLSAIDDRITVSVPVVMVSANFFGGCTCESGMPIHRSKSIETNNAEIAALIAPKPMLVISDGDDWTKNTPHIEYPYIQNIYKLFDAEENIKNVHLQNEVHNYGFSKRLAVYKFFAKYLDLDIKNIKNEENEIDEKFVTLLSIHDLKVFKNKPIAFIIDWDYNLSPIIE